MRHPRRLLLISAVGADQDVPVSVFDVAEWDRRHAAVAYWPDILEYQTHTTRTFPLIVVDPVPDPARPKWPGRFVSTAPVARRLLRRSRPASRQSS
jgi:hypothetical protein